MCALSAQDLKTLNVEQLNPLSPEVISRQATINIGAGVVLLGGPSQCCGGSQRQLLDDGSTQHCAVACSTHALPACWQSRRDLSEPAALCTQQRHAHNLLDQLRQDGVDPHMRRLHTDTPSTKGHSHSSRQQAVWRWILPATGLVHAYTLHTPYTHLSHHITHHTGTIGHVAHGKSTVVKAISGVQTVRFKNELERNITIKLGYANAKIYKCPSCERPSCYRAYGSSKVCLDCGV